MRLFVAIGFPDAAKRAVATAVLPLRANCRGNFTHRENLHLTLAFLGETPPAALADVERCLAGVLFRPFPLSITRFGSFPSGDHRTVFLVADDGIELSGLAAAVRSALGTAGIAFDSKPFIPHLTVVRECDAPPASIEALPDIPPLSFAVTAFTLFESLRVDDRLVYRPIRVYAATSA